METLLFFDQDANAGTTALSLGTVAPHSSDDTQLNVVNGSDLYQAQDVTVTVSGDDAIQLWLSLDGDTFTASINLGDIAPRSASPTFWLRRVTSDDTGACTAALTATPAAWTDPIDTSTSTNIPLDTEGS